MGRNSKSQTQVPDARRFGNKWSIVVSLRIEIIMIVLLRHRMPPKPSVQRAWRPPLQQVIFHDLAIRFTQTMQQGACRFFLVTA
jgi:hypothetical protein